MTQLNSHGLPRFDSARREACVPKPGGHVDAGPVAT